MLAQAEEELRWAQACPNARCAEVVAAVEARVGEFRCGDAGLSPMGIQVREVQARVDGLRARVRECDAGIGTADAQMDRLRFEAAEAKQKLQVG